MAAGSTLIIGPRSSEQNSGTRRKAMKLRTSIASAGAAAVLGATAALALPAAASTHRTTHTLEFTSVTARSVNFSATTGGQQDTDVSRAGKIIGFDELYFAFNPKTKTASGEVALDIAGGFLYGTFKLASPVTHGRVTGGTGIFAGATGAITAKSLNKSGTRMAITITYST
jgi:hypothetical protein